eukprot:6608269-Prymnesium_polylepis.1
MNIGGRVIWMAGGESDGKMATGGSVTSLTRPTRQASNYRAGPVVIAAVDHPSSGGTHPSMGMLAANRQTDPRRHSCHASLTGGWRRCAALARSRGR